MSREPLRDNTPAENNVNEAVDELRGLIMKDMYIYAMARPKLWMLNWRQRTTILRPDPLRPRDAQKRAQANSALVAKRRAACRIFIAVADWKDRHQHLVRDAMYPEG